MSWLTGKDISHWQGSWVDTGEEFVIIKMSGGDAGLYTDPQATNNYNSAIRAGKVVGGYHFAGGGDPVAEADYFVRAMAPVAENDLYCLDWEISHSDPVGWCLSFVNEVHSKVGVWPLLYINLSTLNTYDWSPVLNNCGLWLADWSVSPDANAPTSKTYVMQQYTDTPYDKDAFFGTREELQAYGYHAPTTTTPPAPSTPPVTPPQPTLIPSPSPAPATPPVVTPTPTPTAPPVVSKPTETKPTVKPTIDISSESLIDKIIDWLFSLVGVKR